MNVALKRILFTALILAVLYIMLDDLLQGNWKSVDDGWNNLSTFWSESLWPPDWSVLEARPYPECTSSIGFFALRLTLGCLKP